MLHIGPGVFEVAGASKGLLLEVAVMERRKGEGAWRRGAQGKKGERLARVNSTRKQMSSAETSLPPHPARETGHFGWVRVCFAQYLQ